MEPTYEITITRTEDWLIRYDWELRKLIPGSPTLFGGTFVRSGCTVWRRNALREARKAHKEDQPNRQTWKYRANNSMDGLVWEIQDARP